MAYTDDGVRAKLSALNETQESIVTVAQWVMFHRRHADRTAQIWLQRLKESSSNKRLNLIYLANEVAQQSKARKKDDFLIAWSPIIAEATALAFKSSSTDVQTKLRRVVEVWRQRQIFEPTIQDVIEARVEDVDKAGKKKSLLGGSLFSSSSGPSAPPEIQPIVSLQIAVTKAAASTTSAVPTAESEYEKLTDPSKPTPTPPVHAARLSALVKNLANAEGAVAESIKARRNLIEGLEKLMKNNTTALAAEEAQKESLTSRKNAMETKKREVEDGIMRGLSADSTPAAQGSPLAGSKTAASPSENSAALEPERPHVEELTPPPPEPLTPNKSPNQTIKTETAEVKGDEQQPEPTSFERSPMNPADPRLASRTPSAPPPAPQPAAGADLLSSLSMPAVRHHPENLPDGSPDGAPTKKRKMEDEYSEFGTGEDPMADLDEDVAELLRAESGSAK
ncbi:hypothetical protein ACLMJK_004736 [Lecanora helva]